MTNNTGTTVTLSYQFAATAAVVITSAEITVTAPVTGAEPNETASVGTANFTADTVVWNPTSTKFVGGTKYTATVILTAKSGYVFPATLTTATINGNAAVVTNNTGTTVTLSYQFVATAAVVITSAEITVTAPVTGAEPNETASVGTANFTADTVVWNPTSTKFVGGTKYTATVILTAKSGYVFPATLTTATINGNAAVVTNNTGTTVTLSYQFVATAAVVITSVEITVIAPVTGAVPDTTATIVDTANFTAGAVAWDPTATKFAGGTKYTATVILTAKSGYVLPATLTTATINGSTATVTGHTGTTVTLSYQFAVTATPGGGTSTLPSTPEPTPELTPTPEPTSQPTAEVFNSSVVNSASLVEKLTTLVAAAKTDNTTTDVADIDGHWAKGTIATFLQLQLIRGYEDGTIRPNENITRAEFTAILSRVFNIQVDNSSNVAFKDLDKHWAKDAIVSLAAAGVIKGYGDGMFRPEQTITREEMVIILSRIVNLNNIAKDTSKSDFTDLDRSYAANEIITLAQAGIVKGKGNNQFDPKGNATRAEAFEIILNVLKLDPQVKSLLASLH